MRKVLLSLTLLIAGAMSVWAETTTSYLVKEATTTLTDGTYVLVAMTNHGTGPCYYSSAESDTRFYRYDKNVNVQVGGYIDGAQYIWTIKETTTDGVQKITVTNVGDPTKAFPVDVAANRNFQGTGVAELIAEKHTIGEVDYFALKLENVGYIHANAPGGNPNLSYWDSYNDDGTCVKFRFYPVEEAYQFQHQFTTGAYYRLVCVSPKTGNKGDTSYNTLTWNGESNLVTSPMDIENDNQVFMFEDAGVGKYYLKNLVAGKYLNKINQGGYRSAVVDKADACKLDVSNHEGVVGQFKLHNSESASSNHCLFAENDPEDTTVPYACSGWNNGANSASAWHLVSVSLETLFGAGTEDSPYLINNVDDLILFRNSVNAGEAKYSAPGVHVALGADIDLAGENWTPIGNAAYDEKYQPVDASKVFSGVFDGKGKVISNLNVSKYVGGVDEEANVGLFAVTGAGAVIKDLILTNVNIETDGRNVGALAGFAYMATLSNITVNGNIQIKGGNNVAGVAAMTRHYAMSATNISVSGAEGSAIVGNNIVGGIFAEIAPNGSTQKFDGLNVENVAITGAGGVGGIVGLLTTGTVENVSVKNVVLTGRTDYQGNAMGRIRLGSVAGLMGGKYATIANADVDNVTAKNLNGDAVELPVIGANYAASSNATEAKIGDTYYATFEAAMAAQGTDDVELLVEKAITLDDANAYTYTKGAYDVAVEYSRNLIPGIWNPVYIPFDASVDADDFEVAEFTAAEGTTITLTKLDANEYGEIGLSANTAYVVRPIDGNNTLSLDAWGYIYSNEEESQPLGEGFSVRGNYNVLAGSELGDNDRIVSKAGEWAPLAGTSTLKPFRLILTIPAAGAQALSMRVLDNTTGVEETIMDGQEALVIYDLMGRRVETMTEGGIYIVNGKKIVF